MKKVLLMCMMFMLFAGAVSASGINGDYKGNPVVKVASGGVQLADGDVPAMILDGRTLVPISLLRQLGAVVTWDQKTYVVDVKLPSSNEDIDDYLKIANDAEIFRYIYFINDQVSLSNIINFGIIQNSSTQSNFQKVIEQANRLLNDVNTTWINNLTKISYYKDDTYILNEIDTSFLNLKNDLLKLDSDSASKEQQTIKKYINILYSKYDSNISGDESDAFKKVVDHYK